MSAEYLLSLITILVSLFMGVIVKKLPILNNKVIPIQNLLIGMMVALINFIMTKDFSIAISVSGLIAGGTYDIVHNLKKIVKE